MAGQGVTIWAVGGFDFLGSGLQEVPQAWAMGCLRFVRRCTVSLNVEFASRNNCVYPGLHHLLQDLQMLVGVDLGSLGLAKKWVGLTSTMLMMRPSTITVAENLVTITIGTLLLHFLFTFCPVEGFLN